MKKQLLFIISALTLAGLYSCEKDVNFTLGPGADKVVVEGTIESGLPPYVFLSKSIGFFSKVDLGTLGNSFLHDAVITVTEGNKTFTLKEYAYSNNGIDFYFYSVDTADIVARNFVGAMGKSYDLKIELAGKTYTATTAIPFVKPLDSLWAEPPPPEDQKEDYPDLMRLTGSYTDPDTPGNRIRYYTKKNREGYLPPYYSVYDDAIINGTRIEVEIDAGFNKMDTINRETFGYFYKGDTVTVKWSAIDKGVFDFWRTLEFSYGSTGNPFTTPVSVTSNISNGALGVWAGYGASTLTYVIH